MKYDCKCMPPRGLHQGCCKGLVWVCFATYFSPSRKGSRPPWLYSQKVDKLVYILLKTHISLHARTQKRTGTHTHATQNSAGVRVTVMDAIPEWP